MKINAETVKIGLGIAGKVIADKGVSIAFNAATENVESTGAKVAVFIGKMAVGKLAGDEIYHEVTGRDFNKDASKFIIDHLPEDIKKQMESSKKGVQAEAA